MKRSFKMLVPALVALAVGGAGVAALRHGPAQAAERQAAVLSPEGYTVFGPLVNGATVSFLRFVNNTSATTTFKMRVVGYPTGTQYTSSDISLDVPAHAAPQKSINDLSALSQNGNGPDITPRTGDTGVLFYVKSDIAGKGVAVMHVTFNAATGYFENASVCNYDAAFKQDTSILGAALMNVHTTTLGTYPSTVILTNPDAVSRVVTGTVYDGATGASVGTFPATTIPANGSVAMTNDAVQTAAKFTPTGTQQHMNIVFRSGDSLTYTAIPSHIVTQASTGANFNMTSPCQLNPVHTSLGDLTGGSSGGSTGTGTGTTLPPNPVNNPSGS